MTELNLELSKLSDFIIQFNNVDADEVIDSICTDSRKIKPGDWFICLKGESLDGHDFIDKAIADGAAGIIYEGARNVKGIQVADTTIFLGKLSALHLKQINPFVIAITGSNGKTSVKEMLTCLLAEISKNEVCSSSGNFNNQFGVPYTLLGLKPHHKYLVVELGTNHPGEIKYLSEITNADISIITSVSMGHAGNFGSAEKIIEEKSDILCGMKPGGKLFLPSKLYADKIINEKALKYQVEVKTPDDTCQAVELLENGTSFTYRHKNLFLSAAGRHQFENCRLVLSVMEEITKNNDKVKVVAEKLSEYKPVKGRLQKIPHKKFNLWDDSYNANPASFAEAVGFIASIHGKASFFGAFGMMGELGVFSEEEHRKLGELAAKSGMSGVFFSSSDETIRTAFKEGWVSVKSTSESILTGDDTYNAISEGYKFLVNQMKEDDHLLVKGSRSTRMERMLVFFS
jgi:UDP-N-acetylmuramoyl-tripeptide--D-alanyl-D-alanine ligase